MSVLLMELFLAVLTKAIMVMKIGNVEQVPVHFIVVRNFLDLRNDQLFTVRTVDTWQFPYRTFTAAYLSMFVHLVPVGII
ncbi:hypothetical protein D3C71_1894290 [compost metagenome]